MDFFFYFLSLVVHLRLTSLRDGAMVTHTGNRDSLIQVSACYHFDRKFKSSSKSMIFMFGPNSFFSRPSFGNQTSWLCPDKAVADANAAAWAAYYAQYSQQPQAPMTPTSGAPGTTQTNGQGN